MLFIIFLNLVSILTRSFASVHDKDRAANVSLLRCSFQTLHESYIKMSKNFFYFSIVWECLEEFTNEANWMTSVLGLKGFHIILHLMKSTSSSDTGLYKHSISCESVFKKLFFSRDFTILSKLLNLFSIKS